MNVKPNFKSEAFMTGGGVLRRAVTVYGEKIFVHPAELEYAMQHGRNLVTMYKKCGRALQVKNEPGSTQLVHVENIVNLEA